MKKKKESITMKEALDQLPSKRKTPRSVSRKNRNLRDILWEYPYFVSKIFKNTNPFGFILLFLILGFGLFTFLRGDIFAQRISSSKASQITLGHVGAISTFNPLFNTQNDVDKMIQEMVFSKFVYFNKDGDILPGIASSWDISEGSKVYEFEISDKYYWHDGKQVGADDVVFTFQTAIDLYKEHDYDTIGVPLEDVVVEKVSDSRVKFTLKESSATFPEAISVYIVPKHILEEVSLYDIPFSRFARTPIGSGPYMIQRTEPSIVALKASNYYIDTAKISTIIVRLYSEDSALESAFRNGLLDGLVVNATDSFDFVNEYSNYESFKVDMPFRQRMMFFNTRKEKFESEELRAGISSLVNIEEILDLAGIYGVEALGPISQESWAYDSTVEYIRYNPEFAKTKLSSVGYKRNENNGYFESSEGKILSFTLSYLDNSLNSKLVEAFKLSMESNGIIVNLEPLSYRRLTQEIITTRDFEVLMYEINMELDPDQYSLWHKLKVDHPDLNLSGYSYERVDILLEDGRKTSNKQDRLAKYNLVQRYVVRDAPVIFLYHPEYLVVLRKEINGYQKEGLVRIENLFSDIYKWDFLR